MTLKQRLKAAGISLCEPVGVIYKARDKTGRWHTTHAMVAQVCNDAPAGTENYRQVREYDPECSLMLKWVKIEATDVVILSKAEDAEIDHLAGGGLIIESPDVHISIGQSKKFMKKVFAAWCNLPAEER
jgi:hypothetical protein